MQDYIENSDNMPEILSAGEVRVLIPYNPEIAHYNAAAIELRNSPGTILIVLREVLIGSVKAGTPDKGNVVVYLSTPEKVEKIDQLDLSDSGVSHLEDARACMSKETFVDDQGVRVEEVFLGMTAIRNSDNKPVAATVNGKVIDGKFSLVEGSFIVYDKDEGKNMTPISGELSLFRREGDRYTLEVVKHSNDENGHNKLRVEKKIQFPKKSWCEWQIGTQAQFLPGGILPIHGVNRFSLGIDPQTNEEVFGYTYSLGLAQLDENLNVIKVTDVPMFNRESFKNIHPMGQELDTNKDVIYCCGYSLVGDKVKFIISIGDQMTVEVSKSLAELQKALEKSSPIKIEQIPDKLAA